MIPISQPAAPLRTTINCTHAISNRRLLTVTLKQPAASSSKTQKEALRLQATRTRAHECARCHSGRGPI